MKIGNFELKPRENTKWDYIVPIGFGIAGILFLTFVLAGGWEYGLFDIGDIRPEYTAPDDWYRHTLFVLATLSIMLFSTRYLGRLKRVLVFPSMLLVSIFGFLVSYFI